MKDIGEFADTKEVIRIRNSMTDRKHNGQRKKGKMTNGDLQDITQKTNDREPQYMLSFYINDNIIDK